MRYQHILTSTFMTVFVVLILAAQSAIASMTISGTRIIFPGNEREKTVRTTNKGNTATLVQVWVDDGDKNEDINSVNTPFMVTPPMYRVEPGKGQSIRLIYNGMSLPQDRESVYWFNMLEIPPMNEAAQDTDRLELAFRTRIKIFYRPAVLKSSSGQEIEQLRWEMIDGIRGIKVTNPTPYYFSFDSAYITSGSGRYPLAVDMIPPFGSKEFLVENRKNIPATINDVIVRQINDYGSTMEYQLTSLSGKGLSVTKLPK